MIKFDVTSKRDGDDITTKNAKVNGVPCVVYDYEMESLGLYCSCYFPELGYRMPILATLIEVGYDKV